MQFNIPRTKDDMYDTLQEIYTYYRITRQEYTAPDIPELHIDRLTAPSLTETQLREKAETLLFPSQRLRVLERKTALESKISEIDEQILALNQKSQSEQTALSELYAEAVKKAKKEAVKNGLENSSVVISKIANLESKKGAKISKIVSDTAEKVSVLNERKEKLLAQYGEADSFYQEIEESEITAKFLELKDKQKEQIDKITVYNSEQYEKEQKYNKSVEHAKANLILKYMEIKTIEPTKEELVSMGYYEDVIRCVSGYYDTLPSLSAWSEFSTDVKIIPYLDDYYESVAYMYRSRAN